MPMAEPRSAADRIELIGAITIREIEATRSDLLAKLQAKTPLEIDLSGVTETDISLIQLMLAALLGGKHQLDEADIRLGDAAEIDFQRRLRLKLGEEIAAGRFDLADGDCADEFDPIGGAARFGHGHVNFSATRSQLY